MKYWSIDWLIDWLIGDVTGNRFIWKENREIYKKFELDGEIKRVGYGLILRIDFRVVYLHHIISQNDQITTTDQLIASPHRKSDWLIDFIDGNWRKFQISKTELKMLPKFLISWKFDEKLRLVGEINQSINQSINRWNILSETHQSSNQSNKAIIIILRDENWKLICCAQSSTEASTEKRSEYSYKYIEAKSLTRRIPFRRWGNFWPGRRRRPSPLLPSHPKRTLRRSMGRSIQMTPRGRRNNMHRHAKFHFIQASIAILVRTKPHIRQEALWQGRLGKKLPRRLTVHKSIPCPQLGEIGLVELTVRVGDRQKRIKRPVHVFLLDERCITVFPCVKS